MVSKLSIGGKFLKPFALGWRWLRSSKFWSVIVFTTVILPSIYGAYQQLTGYGLEWYFAIPSSVAVELGGQLLTLYNGYLAFVTEGITLSNSVLLISGVSALFTLAWIVSFWFLFVEFFFGDNAPPMGIYVIGLVVFGSFMLITLLVDAYVLSENVTRLSGMTYWFENPDQAQNMAEFLYNKGVNSTMGNESALNGSVNSTGELP